MLGLKNQPESESYQKLSFFDMDNFQSGNWQISYYFDNYNDETNKFIGYLLKFDSNGDFIATKNENISKGKWKFNHAQKKLQIDIKSGYPLVDLDDEWMVTNHTEQDLILQDNKLESFEKLHLKKIST